MKTRSFLRTAAFSAAGAALGSAAAAAEETPAGTAARPEVDAEGLFYLDNGRIRLGAKRDWGCGIAWFSQSGAKRNLVNHWDHGRLIQQSYYGKADGSKWGEKPWRWNPVQGGDYKGRAAKVLAVDLGKDWFASKSQARHWASGADLPDVIFEQRAELMGEVALVRFKMTYTGDGQHPATHHEIPAVFAAPELETLALYDGTEPWEGGALTRSTPGWPNETRKPTEPWAAYLGADGTGIGVMSPKMELLTCYRFGADRPGDPSRCSYFAPLVTMAIGPGTVFEYDVFLTIGTADQIRERFKQQRTPAPGGRGPAPAP